jgi:hypothetical protein
MAHFAELDENNIVLRVLVVNNTDIIDEQGNESEQIGINFLKKLFGEETNWIQTSYNNKFRGRYAGIGFVYVTDQDRFMPPQPYPSWTFNEEVYDYVSPVPCPEDGKEYYWNESAKTWEEYSLG